eukprot:TRINITY_DN7808_c0_g1_i1.p1 TRINITY_DN7808_c0_g1~~TRINITY_DN7808_c0_g1_i1.p1  ORF type:complete len:495 (-),score=95.21 TRINITY_DN7808_c0_g1_i1:94-1578(-)
MAQEGEDSVTRALKIKREEFRVEIRKRTMDRMFAEKRTCHSTSEPAHLKNLTEEERRATTSKSVVEFKKALLEQDWSRAGQTLEVLRHLSSNRDGPTTKHIGKTGVLPYLVDLLDIKYASYPKVQLEAVWILTNIASGDSTDVANLVAIDGVSKIIGMLFWTKDTAHIETAIWALGNVCGESLIYRDQLLAMGIIDLVLEILGSQICEYKILKTLVWLTSNLVRGRPYPPEREVLRLLPVLAQTIHMESEDILSDVMWSISYLSDVSINLCNRLIELRLIPRIAKLLLHKNFLIRIPTLRAVGNLANSTDEHTKLLLENGVLVGIGALLEARKPVIRREACWALSNLFACPTELLEYAVQTDIVPRLVRVCLEDEIIVRKEGLMALVNLANKASLEQAIIIIDQGILEAFIRQFTSGETDLIMIALEGLDQLLTKGNVMVPGLNSVNPIARMIEQKNMIKPIEELQFHDEEKVFQGVQTLIERHFNCTQEMRGS